MLSVDVAGLGDYFEELAAPNIFHERANLASHDHFAKPRTNYVVLHPDVMLRKFAVVQDPLFGSVEKFRNPIIKLNFGPEFFE